MDPFRNCRFRSPPAAITPTAVRNHENLSLDPSRLPIHLREIDLNVDLQGNDGRRYRTSLSGDGEGLFLDQEPLLSITPGPGLQRSFFGDIQIFNNRGINNHFDSTFGSIYNFFAGRGLTTNLLLPNFFSHPQGLLIEQIPVAYREGSGERIPFSRYSPQAGVRELPYFLELARTIYQKRPLTRLNFQRLYTDLQTLTHLPEASSHASAPFLHHGSIGLTLVPESFSMNGVSVEFDLNRSTRVHENPILNSTYYTIFNDPIPDDGLPRFQMTSDGIRPVNINPIEAIDIFSPCNPTMVFNPFPARACTNFNLREEDLDRPPQYETIVEPDRLYFRIHLDSHGVRAIQTNEDFHLSRIFIPEILNLGRTSFHLDATAPNLSIHLNQISSEIREMNWGGFSILSGSLEDGENVADSTHSFLPGLHLEGEIGGAFSITGNLQLSLVIQGPQVPLRVSAQILLRTRLLQTSNGLLPELGENEVVLQNVSVAAETDVSSSSPLLAGANIRCSDIARANDLQCSLSIPNIRREVLPSFLNRYRGGALNFAVPLQVLQEGERRVYQPTIDLNDFQSTIFLSLLGRESVNDSSGVLQVSTTQEEPCSRNYGLHFQLGALNASLGNHLSLLLENLQAHFQISQSYQEDGSIRFEIPIASLSSQASARQEGILRGPFHITQESISQRPLEILFHPQENTLSLSHLNLQFLLDRFHLPALLNASRPTRNRAPQISGLTVDGRFQGHWNMNLDTLLGNGQLCLNGDSRDVVFYDGRGRAISNPLISNTRWCATRIQRSDLRRQTLWGRFFLDTTIDFGLLRYFGIEMNMRERMQMAHDNFPYSLSGYRNIERQFFGRLGNSVHRGAHLMAEVP
ncbi:MAG: hypothetical protein JNK65_08145 [Deltaproteobacteria bacterium]|nr:hypothetical protein [Deltaproteobacteria bacterium]